MLFRAILYDRIANARCGQLRLIDDARDDHAHLLPFRLHTVDRVSTDRRLAASRFTDKSDHPADARRLIQILRDKTGIACHVYVFRFCYITRKRVCNDFEFFPRL